MLAAVQSAELLNSITPLVLLALAASFLGLLREHTVTRAAPAVNVCPCGYDFVGLADAGKCPECGEPFDQRTPREIPKAYVWLSRKGLPTVAIALALWLVVMVLSWPIARGVLTMLYLADGFSWETSLNAPLVRELEWRYGWEELAVWTTIAAVAPILARRDSRRRAIVDVLWAHAIAIVLTVIVPCAISVVRIALR